MPSGKALIRSAVSFLSGSLCRKLGGLAFTAETTQESKDYQRLSQGVPSIATE